MSYEPGTKRDQPGPGSYDIDGLVGSHSPKYTANGRREIAHSVQTPGPGTYQPSDVAATSLGKAPQYGFGTSSRHGSGMSRNPGPGTYGNDSQLGGPKYTFRGKTTHTKYLQTPGPGEYGA